ncbi:guanylate-binding protein 1-like isoform X2 [Lissotriton helveticus]
MEAPVCLIRNDDNAPLHVQQDALEILKSIDQPLVVVAIGGMYRTGKSYLMNMLSKKKKGFSIGSSVQSHTKGIWMLCIPHPRKPGHTLVLLDTEGVGDLEKVDSKNDLWIVTLAVLLSSVFVYNSMSTINQKDMDQLYLVTELADCIRVRSKQKNDEDNNQRPSLVWVVRDFSLQLKTDEGDLTEKEYLEHMLKLKKGHSKTVMNYNLPREYLKDFFPARNCFVFASPAPWKDISDLKSLPENALEPRFVRQTRKFCDYILHTAEVKHLAGQRELNGRMFGFLVQNYTEIILSGGVPSLENMVLSLATSETEAAVKDAMEHYKTQMQKLVIFPAETHQLSDLHEKYEQEALQIFSKRSFKDKGGLYQKDLKNQLVEQYVALVAKNENSSLVRCRSLLKDLSTKLEKNVSSGDYTKAGGHTAYICDRDEVVKQFQESPNKGVKAQEVVEEYLASKKGEADSILNTDRNLTATEKRLAEEKAKAALSEQEKKAAEEKVLQAEQLLRDQERSHQENLLRLEAKRREEAERERMEAQNALEDMLRRREDQMRQEYEEKARRLESETGNLIVIGPCGGGASGAVGRLLSKVFRF